MKKLTQSLLALSFFIGMAFNASASQVGTEKNPGFDIINRTENAIRIYMVNATGGPLGNEFDASVDPARTVLGKTILDNDYSQRIAIDKPTVLFIWAKKSPGVIGAVPPSRAAASGAGTESYFEGWQVVGPEEPSFIYHFKPGKSIYVALDKEGLRPQSNDKGVTEAGYPDANIVSKNDIIRYKKKGAFLKRKGQSFILD
ncbi:hypothetical protein H0X06_00140 [Candidatus Dependentiae bacterium]|nr:hypothetical protein [Candidatus Dependentiae bacterium]